MRRYSATRRWTARAPKFDGVASHVAQSTLWRDVLETAFAALYTGLVKTGILTLEKLVALMHDAPVRRFGLGGGIEPGQRADLTVFDLARRWTVEPERFLTMGRATPFAGARLYGRCLRTYVDGKIVFENKQEE